MNECIHSEKPSSVAPHPHFHLVALTWQSVLHIVRMLRQNARLRREYLYKKATDAKDSVTAERKRKFRDAVESGKPVPTELRNDAEALQREIALDDAAHEQPSDGIDSEYFNAGVTDPKVLVTTSRDPSSKLVQSRSVVKVPVLLVPSWPPGVDSLILGPWCAAHLGRAAQPPGAPMGE